MVIDILVIEICLGFGAWDLEFKQLWGKKLIQKFLEQA